MSTQTTRELVDVTGRPAWEAALATLGPGFAARAAAHDAEGSFVAANYRELKESRVLSAGVPRELGGGGATHAELCELLRRLAHDCPSTALALSMHTHLVAAAVWRWRHTGAGEALLLRVATEELGLVSTGATDWVDSNGSMEKVAGGYLVSGRKVFASGSAAADLLVTSARLEDSEEGPLVLHFAVPLGAQGIRVACDWDAHGMRGSGSNTVFLDHVFVPDSAVSLRRPAGVWPPALSVVMIVALPIIMSVYLGVAQSAVALAHPLLAKRTADPDAQRFAGEMANELLAAELAVADMVQRAAGYQFAPDVLVANRTLMAKTVATKASIAAVEKAMEAAGGAGFSRSLGLERLLRDVRAAHYHPLPEVRQLRFTGRLALGLPPVEPPATVLHFGSRCDR